MTTLVASALGTWMGIQAVRLALAMIIWNVAEDNTGQAGQVATLMWIAGIGGSFLVRFLPIRRPALWLAVLFGVLVVLRQAFPGESSSPAFAFAAWVVWLWWLPAFIRRVAGAGRLAEAASGIVLGVALQVAGQIALHGLDLQLIDGPASVIAALLLAAAFVFLVSSMPEGGDAASGGWGAFALGPYLFVELTLLANLGRLEVATGLSPLAYQLASAAGFVAALLVLTVGLPRGARVAIGVATVLLLAPGDHVGAALLVTLVGIQAGLALGLAAAFTAGPRRLAGRVHALAALGAVVFFACTFVFYSYRATSDFLWPVAGALVVAPGLLAQGRAVSRTLRPAIAAALAILGAMAFAAIPPSNAHPTASAGPDLPVLTYNLHQGLDYWSVPSAPALADRIESANADLVALQEVNRGWDLSAGIDMFAYLRWRLPQYQVAYGRMDTALFGNAILSRFPIAETGYGTLPHINSALLRGYVWATIAAPSGPLLFVSTHFTSYEGFDEERIAQADAYAAFWAKRPRSILAGDYNAHPQDATVARLIGAGLVDAPAAVGLGKEFTYSSGDPHERIDYIFVSPDVQPLSARILEGTASDHRPVLVTVRLR